MKLAAAEVACVRSKGLYITEKCDGCGKLLNQSVRYTSPGRAEVWCSAACQDKAMGWDKASARPKKPAFHMQVCEKCGKKFRAKHEDARFCCQHCQKRARREEQNAVVREIVQPPLAEAHE